MDEPNDKTAGGWERFYSQFRGIQCPRCGCPKTTVTKTRGSALRVVRNRRCLFCDYRFSTREIMFDK